MTAQKPQQAASWRTIVRAVAVMLLVFCGADLAFPQMCSEDNEQLVPTRIAAASPDNGPTPDVPAAPAEDCFCCCSHIIASTAGSPLGKPALVTDPGAAAVAGVPLAPLQLLFQPPRLA